MQDFKYLIYLVSLSKFDIVITIQPSCQLEPYTYNF